MTSPQAEVRDTIQAHLEFICNGSPPVRRLSAKESMTTIGIISNCPGAIQRTLTPEVTGISRCTLLGVSALPSGLDFACIVGGQVAERFPFETQFFYFGFCFHICLIVNGSLLLLLRLATANQIPSAPGDSLPRRVWLADRHYW
jgi:hypothetical protein